MRKPGFTLVELSITVIVATIAVYSLLTIFMTAATENVGSESLSMAFYLASGKLEEVSSKSYDDIVSVDPTPFGSGFADFSSAVVVHFVSSEVLDDPVATDFGYKKVIVKVNSTNLTSTVEVETLVTDISNE